MSQAKIDYRKELKKNRKKILQKEKRERMLGYLGGCALLLAIAGWIGYSAYGMYEEAHRLDPLPVLEADISALDDYVDNIGTEE